jgi:hypothetical protein
MDDGLVKLAIDEKGTFISGTEIRVESEEMLAIGEPRVFSDEHDARYMHWHSTGSANAYMVGKAWNKKDGWGHSIIPAQLYKIPKEYIERARAKTYR